jgi:hypothetical protein
MSQEVLNLTANCNIIVTEDSNAANYFWTNYFTHSLLQSNDDNFAYQSTVDLMGNPIR